MNPPASSTSGRRKVLLIFILSALPVIIAYALYYSGWRPSSTGNFGELLQPARAIKDAALITLDGRSVRFASLHGKWTLLAFGAAQCLKPCTRNLYSMRQVIAAQGKDAERVQSVFIVTDPNALDWLRVAVKDYPGMQVIVGPPAGVKKLVQQFTLPSGSPIDDPDRVYIVDPLGNFLMSYPAGADPSGLRKDLSRLLRASRIG